ncbi:hypothetical protein [Streptomyces poriferorum]|uniref:hypothetical protein n=1 Tax=Streptomyces poriferorum TaxID=2798799 RepID=UPI003532132A
MSHPQSYEILLVPAFTDVKGTADKGAGTKASGAGHSGTGDAAAEDQDTGDTEDTRDAKDEKEAQGTQEAAAGNGTAADDQDAGDTVDAKDTEDVAAENSGSHAAGSPRPGAAIRSAVVTATGETGESGYPRYAGEGMVADIDPATHTVQALLIDGSELDYGLSVRVSERDTDG